MDPQADFTSLLRRASSGDRHASEQIAPVLYRMFQGLATHCRRKQNKAHSLETMDLINEAYLKVFGSNGSKEWADRRHFLAVSASAMRSILVDHARRKKRIKGAITGHRVPLDDLADHYEHRSGGLVEFDHALQRLEQLDGLSAQIVSLRFFTGMKVADIASVVDKPMRTVERKLHVARAWLREEMSRG